MIVVNRTPDDASKINYLDTKNNVMVFNKYKTAKKYGEQKIELKDYPEFVSCLKFYLKFHPKKKDEDDNILLLVDMDGEPLKHLNSITRILNKTLGKKVGSSMIRHIFLSHKFGDNLNERKDIAEKMGHSAEMQTEYIKTD
jgi:integrase